MKHAIALMFSILGLLLLLGSAPAQAAAAAEKADVDKELDRLQQQFERRYPEVRKLKNRGVVGEAADGYLAFVNDDKGSSDARELVDAENADRKKLYDLIAEKEDTTPKKVAERNARRNFKKADSGDWLREEDGRWRQKK